MLKIIIDYDDVLNDCNQAAVDRLNEEKGTRVFLSDIHVWGEVGTLLDERLRYFKDPDFIRQIPLKKGAQDFVKQLTKDHEVFIATSVHPDCAGVRVNEIIHKFPCIDPANILIGQRKDLLTADVLLDDALHNVLSSPVRYPFLFKRPWNEKATGLPKISSYDEFLKIISLLDQHKKPLRKNIFILVGPSASGKSSLVTELLKKDSTLCQTVSYTTRLPRHKGESYHFITEEDFFKKKQEGFFAEVTKYKGAYYGTAWDELEMFLTGKQMFLTGKRLLSILDINGALHIKNRYPDDTSLLYIDRPKEYCIRSILQRKLPLDITVSRIAGLDEERKNKNFCNYIIPNEGELDKTVNMILQIMEEKE